MEHSRFDVAMRSEIPGNAVLFPVAIAGGGQIARLVFERVNRLGRRGRLIAPVRRLLELFGGGGFLFGHTAQMRVLALCFKHG